LRQNLPVYEIWRINHRERQNSQTGVREYQERLPDNDWGICWYPHKPDIKSAQNYFRRLSLIQYESKVTYQFIILSQF
jgi:hypothetical protein